MEMEIDRQIEIEIERRERETQREREIFRSLSWIAVTRKPQERETHRPDWRRNDKKDMLNFSSSRANLKSCGGWAGPSWP